MDSRGLIFGWINLSSLRVRLARSVPLALSGRSRHSQEPEAKMYCALRHTEGYFVLACMLGPRPCNSTLSTLVTYYCDLTLQKHHLGVEVTDYALVSE